MRTPTISTPCLKCGMEKGHSLAICPTCQLVEAQEEANRLTRQSMPSVSRSGSDVLIDILGGIVGVVFCFYFLYWIAT